MGPIPSVDVRQDSMASEQKLLFEAAIANSPPYPAERFAGSGIVICAGGHGKLGSKQGDSVVAFALGE